MKSSLSYRRDIDGLRAMAVLPVVGFHAFPGFVKGGFVGVDIFFVISGFLITSIIVKGLQAGSFSFLDFYRHRVLRIFPALFLVLVSCAIGGFMLLSEPEYSQLGKHIAGGAGFVSNFVLWGESGYFDSASYAKPLLHLWSLGVEEQFYIAWPLVAWLFWRRGLNIFRVAGVVVLLSFMANLYSAGIDRVADFYSPVTRIWEILLGALVVHASAQQSANGDRSRILLNTLSIAGALLIGVALCTFDQEQAYPGWRATLPTVGAALILYAGPTAWFNRYVLARSVLVWIGLISYPLYLWHWPLLSFFRITEFIPSKTELGACAAVLSIVLAWITFVFVEKPLRFSKARSGNAAPANGTRRAGTKSLALITAVTCVFGIGLAIQANHGYNYRSTHRVATLPPLPDKTMFEEMKIYEHYDRPNTSCQTFLNITPLREEVCLANSDRPEVLFIGDSHAMALYSSIYSKDLSLPSVLNASPGCLIYPNLVYKPHGKEWGQDCTGIALRSLEFALKSPSVKTVVISTIRKENYADKLTLFYSGDTQLTDEAAFTQGTEYLVGKLLAAGKKVIYVTDVPYFQSTPENCQTKFVSQRGWGGLLSGSDDCEIKRRDADAAFKEYFVSMDKIRNKFPELKVFDASKVVCSDRTCVQHDDTEYFYIDKDHLSVYGSRLVLSRLMSEFRLTAEASNQ